MNAIWPSNKKADEEEAIAAQNQNIEQANHFCMRPRGRGW